MIPMLHSKSLVIALISATYFIMLSLRLRGREPDSQIFDGVRRHDLGIS